MWAGCGDQAGSESDEASERRTKYVVHTKYVWRMTYDDSEIAYLWLRTGTSRVPRRARVPSP